MGLLSTIGAASGRAFGFTRSAIAAATDAFFNRVTLLLPGNGTNGAQNNTFLDSSTNNFTITRNGNTTQGTFSPFSQTGWSNFFDGATGTRFTLSSSSDFAFGTGAYTMEASVFITARGANDSVVFDCGSLANSAGLTVTTTGQIALGRYGVGNVFTSNAGDVPLNQWVHIAIVRTSTSTNDTRMYANGTLVATGTDNNNWSVTTTPGIGGINVSGFSLSGYISNLRIIKGSAVTPPTGGVTSPLTAVTNTALLTCQSNRFIDTNTQVAAKTLTVNGTISVQAFSPFAPTAAYSAATVGGSGYFDGTGDYLTVADSTAFDLPGDYTIELWIYPAVTGGLQRLFMIGDYRSTFNGLDFYTNASSQFVLYSNGAAFITAGSLPAFAWSHLAVVRSGSGSNNTTLYLNGAVVAQATNTTSFTGVTGNGVSIGLEYSGTGTSATSACYICDARLVKGTAVYTAAFTPPTAPLTAITNTSLLTNFTNAGITDATAKNDLETVGNAQISTTQSKFGGSSMYFDGSGDYLSIRRNNLLLPVANQDFTFECWVYLTATPGAQGATIMGCGEYGTDDNWNVNINSSLQVSLYIYSANTTYTNTTQTLTTNTWHHIAVARSGTSTNNLKVFVNGTGQSFSVNNTLVGTTRNFSIGADENGDESVYTGYIDDLRFTLGYARYTANFTPPTAAFPTQ